MRKVTENVNPEFYPPPVAFGGDSDRIPPAFWVALKMRQAVREQDIPVIDDLLARGFQAVDLPVEDAIDVESTEVFLAFLRGCWDINLVCGITDPRHWGMWLCMSATSSGLAVSARHS